MKVLYILFFSALFSMQTFAQQDAWVYFENKPLSAYFFENPTAMLSQKSIDKRLSKGILIDIHDVPLHEPYIDAVANVNGIQVLAQSKWLNALHVRASLPQIQSLSNFDFVSHIEFANKSLNARNKSIEHDENVLFSKNLEAITSDFNYGNAFNQIAMLQGHLLHQEGFTGQGMDIAVLDNGFLGVNNANGFQRLWSENLILDAYNFVERSNQVFNEGTHGTRVLSNMGGYVSNLFVGTAPDANYYLYVTESNTYESPLEESLWVEAAERADSLGVDVINTSLGYFTFDNPDYNHSYADFDGQTTFMARGTNVAKSRGILCVASAGNSGNTSSPFVVTPGDALGSFTIGAVDANGNYASFSSFGPTVDGRIKPDVVTQGLQAVVINQSNIITTASGTSFSSPILAGLMACLWQALPNLTVSQLENLVKSSSSLNPFPTNQMGFGIPNFYQAYLNGLNLSTEIFEELKIVSFPNPILNQMMLHSNSTVQMNLMDFRLFDVSGKKCLELKVLLNEWIDLNFLKSGLYFYEIQTNDFHFNGKIIKK